MSVNHVLQAVVLKSATAVEHELRQSGISAFRGRLESGWGGPEPVFSILDLMFFWFPGAIAIILGLRADGNQAKALEDLLTICTQPFLALLVEGLRCAHFMRQDIEPYVEVIELVLALDCPVIWTNNLRNDIARIGTPSSVAKSIVTHLSDRRRRLCDFANDHLLPWEKPLFQPFLASGLVDAGSSRLTQTMDSRGQTIPAAIRPLHGTESIKSSDDDENEWVYGDLGSEAVAELLYASGFRPDDMLTAWSQQPHPTGCVSRILWFSPWLWQHCSMETLTRPLLFERLAGQRMFHVLSGNLGARVKPLPWPTSSSLVQALRRLLANHGDFQDPDECRCGCSVSGCTAITSLSQYNARFLNILEDQFPQSIGGLACAIDEAFAQKRVPARIVSELMRCQGFVALGCRHTCCKATYPYLGVNTDLDPEEIEEFEEIRDEDRERLEALEALQSISEVAWEMWDDSLARFTEQKWWPSVLEARRSLQDPEDEGQKTVEAMRRLGLSNIELTDQDPEWYLQDDTASESSEIDWDVDEVTRGRLRAQRDVREVGCVKRAMDRICGVTNPANGPPTEKGRWRSKSGRRRDPRRPFRFRPPTPKLQLPPN